MADYVIKLFDQVKTPDEIIVNLMFNACAQLGTKEILTVVKTVAKQMPKAFYSNSYILTSLLDAFMRCEDMESAQSLFNSSSSKTVQMYGAMMKGNHHSIDKRVPSDIILQVISTTIFQTKQLISFIKAKTLMR